MSAALPLAAGTGRPAYPRRPVWVTADRQWTVTIISLRLTARPRRSTDPSHGDGDYYLAKSGPVVRVFARTVDELVERTGIDLATLREVEQS